MDKQAKQEAVWGLTEIIFKPLYLYLAILGVGRLVAVHGAPPIVWKPLAILVLADGMFFVRTCARTFHLFQRRPQADLSTPVFIAYSASAAVSSVLTIYGIIQVSEVHAESFEMISRLATIFAALVMAGFLVRICVLTARAFAQGMREAN
jgi:hypothetical protein